MLGGGGLECIGSLGHTGVVVDLGVVDLGVVDLGALALRVLASRVADLGVVALKKLVIGREVGGACEAGTGCIEAATSACSSSSAADSGDIESSFNETA
jgi:hypothetical protein